MQKIEELKKEIEKWKRQAELDSDTTDRLSKQLEQKEQECEKLKKQYNCYACDTYKGSVDVRYKMITKQQALEFIYELAQKTEVMLDVSCGEMQFDRIVGGDYLYTSFAEEPTLEATVIQCIKEHMDAIMNYVDKIPVDADILEVEQALQKMKNNEK